MIIPNIPHDLLEHLKTVFPNKLPESSCSPDQLGLLQGQQKVIAYLAFQFSKQNPLTWEKP